MFINYIFPIIGFMGNKQGSTSKAPPTKIVMSIVDQNITLIKD